MAKILDSIKDAFRRKKKKEKKSVQIDELLPEEVVEKIIEKYREKQNVEVMEEKEEKAETAVHNIITVRSIMSRITVPLTEHPSDIIRFFGKIYEKYKNLYDRLLEKLANNELLRKLDFELYAANIKLTARQYVIISLVFASVMALLSLVAVGLLMVISASNPIVAALNTFLTPLIVFIIAFGAALSYPRMKTNERASVMEKELPFALRHLAVVIRSGMSLYNAMESIAAARYKVLSEEFKRTLREISQGKTTEEALESFALRSRSKWVRLAISQILRSLRVGGNLSDAIKRIAEDLSFEQRNRVREFAEKLNMIGVVFMFAGIVFPAILSMLAGIGNAPMQNNILQAFGMPPETLRVIYLVAIPFFMLVLAIFVRRSDPLAS